MVDPSGGSAGGAAAAASSSQSANVPAASTSAGTSTTATTGVDYPLPPGVPPLARAPDMQMGQSRYVHVYEKVTYVVAGVALRDGPQGPEMLMVQEAKKECRGHWYLPAGRVEAGESLVDAMKREMREEAGLECRVVEMLVLQVRGSGWFRITYYVEITGGDLKTVPDKESLAARWIPVADIRSDPPRLQLRNASSKDKDILPLIGHAEAYRDSGRATATIDNRLLPISQAVCAMHIEFLIYRDYSPSNRVDVLVHRSVVDADGVLAHGQPFPTVEYGFEFFFAIVVAKCFKHIFAEGGNVVFAPKHVVQLRGTCNPADVRCHGLAIRVACEMKRSAQQPQPTDRSRYHWISLSLEEADRLHVAPNSYRVDFKMN